MKWTLGFAVVALGLGLTACGSDKPATTQSGVGAGSNQTAGAATVAVAQNPAQGSILVDGQGRTLYLFEKDNGTTSACTGGCAQIWPAMTSTAAPTAGSGADAALLGTADGQAAHQVTYGGHLLYTYSGDAAPGDVKGTSIPDWYPVNASGNKIDKDDDHGSSGGGY